MKYVIFCFMLTAMSWNNQAYSQLSSPADTFPVPKNIDHQLFYIQRQLNTHTIIVELNIESGKVNDERPVKQYWIRYTEGGKKVPLNFIQNKFAYGIQSEKTGEGKYDLTFVSYDKKTLQLEKGLNGAWHVYFSLDNGDRKILKRIYIHIEKGGSFWKPNVKYVELKGIDPVTNKEVRQRIIVKV